MIHYTPPPVLHICGPLVINVHSLFFCLGAIAAYMWTLKRLSPEYRKHLDELLLWMTIFGIVGARLMFVVVNWHNIDHLWQILAFWQGGLVSYGGFLGTMIAWVWYIKKNNLPLDLFCHALGPSALLGWGIGRIGCFLAWQGELGTYTDMPWAFVVGNDLPRHPTMLYLAIGHILFAFIASHLAEVRKINAASISLIFFGAVRAILDYWRDYDPSWLYLGSLAISVIWIIIGIYLYKNLQYPEKNSSN